MKREDLITWLIMLMSLVLISIWGDMSFEFQKRCDTTCAPADAMTPFIGLREACLCDAGDGKWINAHIE